MQGVDLLLDIRGQGQFGRINIFPELLKAGGANDIGGDEWAGRHKSLGKLHRCPAHFARQSQIGVNRLLDTGLLITLSAIEQGCACTGGACAALIFPGQIALRQGE